MLCIVCGRENCAESTFEALVTTPSGSHPLKPIQRNSIGVAGYNKPVRLYDPNNPHITFIQDMDESPEPEPEPEPEVVVGRRIRTVDDANAVDSQYPDSS